MFWIGFLIGLFIGSIIGISCLALITISHRCESEDEEQMRYLAEQKDRNEF